MSNHNIIEELAICVCEQFGITKRELLTNVKGRKFYDAKAVFFKLCLVYAKKYDVARIAEWAELRSDNVYIYVRKADHLLTRDLEFRYDFSKAEYKYLSRNFAPYNLDVVFN